MKYKYIYINGDKTYYKIYENGQVESEKTGHFYKGTIRNGYRWFDLRYNNKKYSRSQHRLLAEAFIENPENLEYVNHKDGNKLNNQLSNLEWVTASTNNLKENRHPSGIDHGDYNIYEGTEEWKPFRNTRYLVSNWGRVKNSQTNKLLKGKITSAGYREFCLRIDGQRKSFRAHRIAYEVWISKDINIINHKDGNKLNNHISNLESVSNSENVMKAIYETRVKTFPKTAQYDLEGNLIKVYENNADAARAMGVKTQSIFCAIKKGYKSCGYIWKHLE